MISRDSEQSRWFTEEVQPHERALRSYLRGQFPAMHDIDDLVQDAYMGLIQAREKGKVANIRAYLFTSARNAAFDVFRRNKRARLEPMTEEATACIPCRDNSAADKASLNQEMEILAQAIEKLPEQCRQVLVLRRIYELSHKEIAARLGIAEHTVEKHVGMGLRRCLQHLRRLGVVIQD